MTDHSDRTGNLAPGSWVFPCDCGDGDYLRLEWDEDPAFRVLWVESHALTRPRLRSRIKHAWQALRGKDYQATEVLLTDETVRRLMQVFQSRPELPVESKYPTPSPKL